MSDVENQPTFCVSVDTRTRLYVWHPVI